MSFEIQSASAALVRALHQILEKYELFVLNYVDDVLIFCETPDEHLKHLKIVLNKLDMAGLKLNLEKCEFFKNETTFLGYKIDKEGISMDPDRLKLIVEYKTPHNS